MGCLSSTEATNDFEANEEFDDEEKEMKPTHKMSNDAEMGIPDEMNVNRLQSTNAVAQPLKSSNIQVSQYQASNEYQGSNNNPNMGGTNNRRGGQVNATQASILNNFNQNAAKNYDMNQYNPASPNSDQASTASKDSSMNGIPEHRMMDSHGNVHVNKFYNVTRNHNLSNASKLTDMSEMPSVAQMQQGPVDSNDNLSMAGYQHMQNLSVANNGLSPVHGHSGHHKMSIDSQTTNGSKMLWDDFSERGSVMTENTSTV